MGFVGCIWEKNKRYTNITELRDFQLFSFIYKVFKNQYFLS